MKAGTTKIIVWAIPAILVMAGCAQETKVEAAPPAEQKVVMVPAQRNGEPVNDAPVATTTPEAAPAAPGSTPDTDNQPGDRGNKSGN
ncbi:MAG: hypothetical protein ACKVQS_12905 [Fimbriimonadaceae bacterium]